MTDSEMRLHGGEMSAQEIRAVRAVLANITKTLVEDGGIIGGEKDALVDLLTEQKNRAEFQLSDLKCVLARSSDLARVKSHFEEVDATNKMLDPIFYPFEERQKELQKERDAALREIEKIKIALDQDWKLEDIKKGFLTTDELNTYSTRIKHK